VGMANESMQSDQNEKCWTFLLLDVIFHMVLVTALLPFLRLGEWRASRRKPLLAVLLPTLLQPHMSHYFSDSRTHQCWLYPYLLLVSRC
jgi:hypothetical protein